MNALLALQKLRQSVWLDYIRRGLITSGELGRLINEDGLRGVTSNPAIFEKAIAGSNDYAEELQRLERGKDSTAMQLYERLAIHDIQDAADVFRPVFERTGRRDGYVSLEVSPKLAHDTQETIKEARRLWKAVGRDNVMIKVPATPEGLPAIRQLLSEGININITLLFAQEVYEQVAEAFLAGLEALAKAGGDLSRTESVASFFVSRIDTMVDNIATDRLKTAETQEKKALLSAILGRVAIANAKLAYQSYKQIFSGRRWAALASKGARTQRLLWASTSAKNPKYRDVMYVEELIGPDTINTIPPATLEAFRDHGRARASLEENLEDARDTMEKMARAGISMRQVGEQLLADGVRLFIEPFDQLLDTIASKARVPVGPARLSYRMPDQLADGVKASLEDWHTNAKVRRLWARDSSLWTNTDESNWLGWLGITDDQLAHIQRLTAIGEEVKRAGLKHALVLGMGGSSLCPEVLKETFGKVDGYPELHVLDSTDPAQVKSFEVRVDMRSTLFIVSSKSGGTLEPNIFKQYFFEQVKRLIGPKEAASRFIAITDPGSSLQHVAEGDGFRHIFFGLPDIGGRYSALSNFGMVPAAIMGLEVPKFLDRAEVMVHACASCVPAQENPGVVLGTIMGVLAKQGRDKVTLIASPGVNALGAWLEQLLAESTGKEGKGLIPVDREELGPPEVYGRDRLFVYIRLDSGADPEQDKRVAALEKAGEPVVRITIAEPFEIGAEFFRWEIATAVAGSIIGINSFNQPDVEASKQATRELTAEFERRGSLPNETPIVEDQEIKLFTDEKNAGALAASAKNKSAAAYLKAHLDRIRPGDYLAILAYLERNDAHERVLQAMRHAVRDRKRVATCLGFGPRFLHSTGQAYKGGPNSGVFLQITCDDAIDVPVPGQRYTFGVVKQAQARGDFEVLAERDRRALRVHLSRDVSAGLDSLNALIGQALNS